MKLEDFGKPIWETKPLIDFRTGEFSMLEQSNPVLHYCMSMYRGGTLSLTGALCSTISYLIHQNSEMFALLVKYVQRYGVMNEDA